MCSYFYGCIHVWHFQYKKVKDIARLRQLIFDLFVWTLYLIFFFGFILSFHSIKTASEVTNGLDVYFSTTDNPDKNAAAWVDIKVVHKYKIYITIVLLKNHMKFFICLRARTKYEIICKYVR